MEALPSVEPDFVLDMDCDRDFQLPRRYALRCSSGIVMKPLSIRVVPILCFTAVRLQYDQ